VCYRELGFSRRLANVREAILRDNQIIITAGDEHYDNNVAKESKV
jgi:hypothetical protein